MTGIVAHYIFEAIVLRASGRPPLDVPVGVYEARALQVAAVLGGDDSGGYCGGCGSSVATVRGVWLRKTAHGRRGRGRCASDV